MILAVVVGLTASHAAQAAVPIRLVAPKLGASLSGDVRLRATAPGARAVVFLARWKDVDGVSRAHRIAVDRSASDGWTARWDASSVSRQAGVTVFARALGRGGRRLGTTPERSLSARTGIDVPVPAPAPPSVPSPPSVPAAGGTFTVTGTCKASVNCTVAVRAGTGTTTAKVGELAEGARVIVRCQTFGDRVATLNGSSALWNQLDSGRWVSDLYVSTPKSNSLPRCAPAPSSSR